MYRSSLLALAAAFTGIKAQTDIYGITLDEKVEAMERQLLNPFTLNFVVTPCSVNFNDNPNRGQQTAAEWVRVVFHDVITKGIAGPGLGGLDASISFESDRAENSGIFINVTIGQFSQFSSAFLSMSDLIAVGLSDSLATCDQPTGPRIPLSVGRMDAHEAGPAGVPGPLDSLAFAQAAFLRAGFTQSEMIQAIACGHSLGGVHHSIHPEIVDDSAVSPTNLDGRAGFDSSPFNFDFNVVKEYMDGTTQNPLVVGPLATRSDFRIFNSDNNATISAMNNPSTFRTTCHSIFTKMINTVPNGAVMSPPIGPRPWILRKGDIDVDASGGLTYSGTITGSGSGTRPSTASYVYRNSGGTTVGGTKTSGTKSELPNSPPLPANIGLGTIADYTFSDPIPTTVANIFVQSSYTRPINNNIFISNSRSKKNDLSAGDGTLVQQQRIVRVAVKSSLAVTGTTVKVRAWINVPQQNSVAPKTTVSEITATLKETVGAYKIYQAYVSNTLIANGPMTFSGKLYSSSNALLAETQRNDQNFDWAVCTTVPMTSC